MRVRVVDAWDDDAAAGVEAFRSAVCQRSNRGVRTNGDDPTSLNGHRLRPAMRRVGREDFGVVNDDVGRCGGLRDDDSRSDGENGGKQRTFHGGPPD